MATINIPTTEDLSERLGGLERLLTARKWERAAIVWAFTTANEVGGRPSKTTSKVRRFPTSTKAFADLGFAGLGSEQTVHKYRQAWDDAIDAGHAFPVHPGDTDVQLPDMEWPMNTGHSIGPTPLRTTSQAPATEKAELVARLLDEPGVDSALERLQADQVHEDAKRHAQQKADAGEPVGWQPRTAAERQQRVEQIESESPTARYFDQAEAATDLSGVLNRTATTAERFTHQIGDCLNRMGKGSSGWDEFAALPDTLTAAQRAVRELNDRLSDVEYYQEHGISRLDAGIQEILRKGE